MSRTELIADRLLLRYSVLSTAVEEDPATIEMVRQYAADFARYQMARVEDSLKAAGYVSAARAVIEQAQAVEALDQARQAKS